MCIYSILTFLEKREICNTISIILVYIYSLEMIILNADNTLVTDVCSITGVFAYEEQERQRMLTILFMICMLGVFGKLLIFGVRAAWGVSKLLLTVVFFPVVLVCMVFVGLIHLAFPILIIVGIAALLGRN